MDTYLEWLECQREQTEYKLSQIEKQIKDRTKNKKRGMGLNP